MRRLAEAIPASVSASVVSVVLAGAALTACAGAGGARSVAGGAGPAGSTAVAPARPGSLTPSIPGLFRTGTNACGDPYALNATTTHGTIALVDCPGEAGLTPTPTVHLRVGAQVLISGLTSRESLSVSPAGLTRHQGGLFTALRSGRTEIALHGGACLTVDSGAQPPTCRLLAVVVG